MNIEFEKLTELYQKNKIEEYLKYLESMPDPRKAGRIWIDWCNSVLGESEEKWDDYFGHFTKDQKQRLREMGSSKRIAAYLISIPDDKKSDEDWEDLRACDF